MKPVRVSLVLAALFTGAAWAAGGPPPAPAAGERPYWLTPELADDELTQAGQDALRAVRGLGREHLPSPIVLPDQVMPLRFTHQRHLMHGIRCLECHPTIPESLRAADVNLPREEICLKCHDVAAGSEHDPLTACNTCHANYRPPPGVDRADTHSVAVHPAAWELPAPHLKFNHKVHHQRKIGCQRCHAGIDMIDLATRDNALPTMKVCLTCHDGKTAPARCTTCHEHTPAGRVATDLPAGKLEPSGRYFEDDHHAPSWLTTHRNAAQLNQAYCASCHAPKECIDCHNGVKKPLRLHPNDYVLMHAAQARRNAPNCQSCHRTQKFCLDCHQQTRVVSKTTNEARAVEGLRFHPEGWVTFGARGPRHHAFEAQRNIRACASCHSETTCLECHAGGGRFVGANPVNPHPPGFAAGACDRMRQKNGRVCLKCHTEASCDPGRMR